MNNPSAAARLKLETEIKNKSMRGTIACNGTCGFFARFEITA